MNEDVKRAIRGMDSLCKSPIHSSQWLRVRAHLEAQEAEIDRLREAASYAERLADQVLVANRDHCARAEKAEALLRECCELFMYVPSYRSDLEGLEERVRPLVYPKKSNNEQEHSND